MSANIPFSSNDISNSHDAIRAFGEDTSLVIARPSRSCCSTFWFTIPDGFYAIVTSHDVQVDYEDNAGNRSCVWPPGLHLGPPWLKVSHLVTKNDLLMSLRVTDCMTKDNIPVSIDVTVVFRIMGDIEKNEDPQNIYRFVHHVTPRGLEEQLKSAQTEFIRTIIRRMNYSEVYNIQKMSSEFFDENDGNFCTSDERSTPMAKLKYLEEDEQHCFDGKASEFLEETKEEYDADNDEFKQIAPTDEEDKLDSSSYIKDSMKRSLNEVLNSIGVEIVEVILHGVILPEEISAKMTQSTVILSMERENQAQNHHNLLSLIEKEELIALEQSIEEEKVGLLKQGELTHLIESMEFLYEKSEAQGFIQKEKARGEVEVNLIQAESDYTVQKIINTATLDVAKITKETEAESAVAKMDAECEVKKIEAFTDMEGAYFEATGQKAILKAEVMTTPMMRNVHTYNLEMLKIRAQMALAENEMLVITGTSGGVAANNMLMVDASLINNINEQIPESKRQRIFQELVRLSKRN